MALITRPVKESDMRTMVRKYARESVIWGELEKQLGEDHDLSRVISEKRSEAEKLTAETTRLAGLRDKVLAEQSDLIAAGKATAAKAIAAAQAKAAEVKREMEVEAAALAEKHAEADRLTHLAQKRADDTAEVRATLKQDEQALTKRAVALDAREAGIASKEEALLRMKDMYEAELSRIREFAKGVKVA